MYNPIILKEHFMTSNDKAFWALVLLLIFTAVFAWI